MWRDSYRWSTCGRMRRDGLLSGNRGSRAGGRDLGAGFANVNADQLDIFDRHQHAICLWLRLVSRLLELRVFEPQYRHGAVIAADHIASDLPLRMQPDGHILVRNQIGEQGSSCRSLVL